MTFESMKESVPQSSEPTEEDISHDQQRLKTSSPALALDKTLELLKDELAVSCASFGKYLETVSLSNIVGTVDRQENASLPDDLQTWKSLTAKVEYLRGILQITKLYPGEIAADLVSKLLPQCTILVFGAYDFQKWLCSEAISSSVSSSPQFRNLQRNYSERILQPVISLVHDCLEIKTTKENDPSNYLSKLFWGSLTFLSSTSGEALSRPDFLRVLGLCQQAEKLVGLSPQEDKEEIACNHNLAGRIADLMHSENGRSLVKFCCEISYGSDRNHRKNLAYFLESIPVDGATELPEIYFVLSTYLNDPWFWRTDSGKAITPILITTIRQDMACSANDARKAKGDSKKRAAFVLKAITNQYCSYREPLFDPSIPEGSYISLDNTKDMKMYDKFWAAFFDIYEILNETQLHIVQPVLQKLSIFQEYSSNSSVLMWLPILLTKAICHDNRTVAREGLDRFLQTGQYLQNPANQSYRKLAMDFLDGYVMILIKDHVGWVLNDPEEFFKTVHAFGQFLINLYSDSELPHFHAAEKILTFVTGSGKCMSSLTIYFLVAALDEMMHSSLVEKCPSNDKGLIVTQVFKCVELLANLLSSSMTTVSKYFRDLMEIHCVNVLLSITQYLPHFPKDIDADMPIFTKLLTLLASLSPRTVYVDQAAHAKLRSIMKSYNAKGELFKQVTSGCLYDFTQLKMSGGGVLGLFRFIIVSTLGIEDSDSQLKEQVAKCMEMFAGDNVYRRQGIVKEGLEGLAEFHQHIPLDKIPNIYVRMMKKVLDRVGSDPLNRLSPDEFAMCVSAIEVIGCISIPGGISKLVKIPEFNALLGTSVNGDPLKIFLVRKLICSAGKEDSEGLLESLSEVGEASFDEVENIESYDEIQTIAADYYQTFDTNLFAEYYRLKFQTCQLLLLNHGNVEDQSPFKIISTVLNTIEKCDPKGVAAALGLVKSATWKNQFEENSDIANGLEELVSVGWNLVFDNRKNDAFWNEFGALVDFIVCRHFLHSGTLNRYADLIFEHGETIPGLSFVFVQALVKADFPREVMKDSHAILLKAALVGSPVPKNNRVGFAIWDYLRNDVRYKSEDPENFSSDCKARLFAAEKIRMDLHNLLKTREYKSIAENLLRSHAVSLLERNELESKTRKRYFMGSLTHRLKQRIFQVLLLLQPYFNQDISELVLDSVLESLSTDSPQPSVRYMGEWMVTLIIGRYPELSQKFLNSLNECVQNRIGYGAFFSTICLHISKQLQSAEYYDKALKVLTLLTLSQHVTVRIYAQIAFQKIYERAQHCRYQSVVDKYAPALDALLGALAHVSGNCSKLIDNISQDFYVNVFDGRSHYCHEVIFTLLPKISGMIKDECSLHPETIRELIQTPLTNDACNIQELERLYFTLEKSAWHLKTVVADGRELGDEIPDLNPSTNRKLKSTLTDTLNTSQNQETNYQKKINPWKMLSVSEEIEEYRFSTKKRCVEEEGLVVVASLLEHLPNLGGLCRTSEIFGVNKYVVSSLKVINDQQFQCLSVSAQNWVNILEVPVRDLEIFLQTYSAKGYAILGVEQANESSSLIDFVFPKKAVLLLGNEKQGIPNELLRFVDKCIEIPQVGIIRSLNVHVTGALCIWQYASQHNLGN